eukprot:GHVU01142487.1.p1 GENE.GHVU01142487.1~~GHVU01142487.1.p1  ORF type:complete len:157 (-),score=11.73 GHVU01142487.1:521-991(-)
MAADSREGRETSPKLVPRRLGTAHPLYRIVRHVDNENKVIEVRDMWKDWRKRESDTEKVWQEGWWNEGRGENGDKSSRLDSLPREGRPAADMRKPRDVDSSMAIPAALCSTDGRRAKKSPDRAASNQGTRQRKGRGEKPDGTWMSAVAREVICTAS